MCSVKRGVSPYRPSRESVARHMELVGAGPRVVSETVRPRWARPRFKRQALPEREKLFANLNSSA